MNGWRQRLIVAGLILALMWAHAFALDGHPNTPEGKLLFHGTGMLADFALMLLMPFWLKGKLCDHTENLLLLSLAGNAAGWGLYMAYAPPVFYNCFMWGLTIAQGLRLLYPDRDDAHADNMGWHLVPSRHYDGY